jgi:hypothetical protein
MKTAENSQVSERTTLMGRGQKREIRRFNSMQTAMTTQEGEYKYTVISKTTCRTIASR